MKRLFLLSLLLVPVIPAVANVTRETVEAFMHDESLNALAAGCEILAEKAAPLGYKERAFNFFNAGYARVSPALNDAYAKVANKVSPAFNGAYTTGMNYAHAAVNMAKNHKYAIGGTLGAAVVGGLAVAAYKNADTLKEKMHNASEYVATSRIGTYTKSAAEAAKGWAQEGVEWVKAHPYKTAGIVTTAAATLVGATYGADRYFKNGAYTKMLVDRAVHGFGATKNFLNTLPSHMNTMASQAKENGTLIYNGAKAYLQDVDVKAAVSNAAQSVTDVVKNNKLKVAAGAAVAGVTGAVAGLEKSVRSSTEHSNNLLELKKDREKENPKHTVWSLLKKPDFKNAWRLATLNWR